MIGRMVGGWHDDNMAEPISPVLTDAVGGGLLYGEQSAAGNRSRKHLQVRDVEFMGTMT